MGMTSQHKELIREHFKSLLGGECVDCGTSFNLEFHHEESLNIGGGRGSEKRIWELFDSFHKRNIVLLCKQCHIKKHKGENHV